MQVSHSSFPRELKFIAIRLTSVMGIYLLQILLLEAESFTPMGDQAI
jgi:hypothetical protein